MSEQEKIDGSRRVDESAGPMFLESFFMQVSLERWVDPSPLRLWTRPDEGGVLMTGGRGRKI